MKAQTAQMPKLQTNALFKPETFDDEENTVEVTFTTGAQVRRFDWWNNEEWFEELGLERGQVDMDRLNRGAPFLANHDSFSLNSVIGNVRNASVKEGVGKATIKFSEREAVKPIIQDVRDGILRNISVGYTVKRYVEQEELRDGLKVLRAVDWEPHEISLVPIPADASAQVRSANDSFMVEILTREGDKMVDKTKVDKRGAGGVDPVVEPVIDPAALPEPVARVLPDKDTAANDAELEEIRKKERSRIVEIRKFAALSRIDDAVADDFIERGVPLADAKEQMLKKWSDQVNNETTRSDASVTIDERDKFVDAAVSALIARSGGKKLDGANDFRGMRMTELAKVCLERGGSRVKGIGEMEMVGRAFTQSTSDFPVLLEETMNKTLQAAYAIANDTWTRFSAIGSVSDFRVHNRYRLGSFGNIDAVNELGEFENKAIPDGEKATIKASTKGNLINISRQTIINDDLGAFIGLASMFGRAARRTIEADVYALLASNPIMLDGIAMFHASHGNLAGAGTAVTVAAIEAGRVAMASQTDISGNDFLDLRPSVWLGGLSNGGDARVINDARYDNDGTEFEKPNKVRGLFGDIIDSPRISGTEWYLFAAPADAATIEVAFLNGDDVPFLDSQEGFDVDGMRWKVRLDYGVAAIDYRGAYKNDGA